MGRRQSLSQKRDRRFESAFLQRRVRCEPDLPDQQLPKFIQGVKFDDGIEVIGNSVMSQAQAAA
jgi:hypothetical protein